MLHSISSDTIDFLLLRAAYSPSLLYFLFVVHVPPKLIVPLYYLEHCVYVHITSFVMNDLFLQYTVYHNSNMGLCIQYNTIQYLTTGFSATTNLCFCNTRFNLSVTLSIYGNIIGLFQS